MPEPVTIICGAFVLFAAGVLGWVQFLFARRDKRLAEEREREAKAELKAMRSRAPDLVPYFIASDRHFRILSIHVNKGGATAILQSDGDQMLDWCRPEVGDLTKGQVVFFVLENDGAAATEVFLDLDGLQVTIEEALGPPPCRGLFVLCYPFDPAKRGQRQTLTVKFMTRDGARHEQRYELHHGMRWLKRVDPA